jgi:hypothetical protein
MLVSENLNVADGEIRIIRHAGEAGGGRDSATERAGHRQVDAF